MFSTRAHTYFISRRIFYTRLFTLHEAAATLFRIRGNTIKQKDKSLSPFCYFWQSAENVAVATLSPYASRHHQKTIFTFLLVNRQLLFESKTNDRRFSPLAHHHVGRTAKPGKPDECPAKASWREVKDTPQTGPSAFKEAAISERSSSGSRGPSIPLVKRSKRQATMILRGGGREAEGYRDEPWTQWCFRAESSRTSQAHSIPSPTVTAGTQFSPFKHIICARMAVKHHTLQSFTHPVPWYCCVCRLPFYYWAIKGFGKRTISQHMVSWSATRQLKDNRFLAHL